MSQSRKQSLIVTALALIIVGVILAVFALSQPKVYIDNNAASAADAQNAETVSDAQTSSTLQVSFPLNINTCTYDELLAIDGIGAARASAILEYRDVLGSYTSVEQIKNIEGIGDSLYEKISPYLFV